VVAEVALIQGLVAQGGKVVAVPVPHRNMPITPLLVVSIPAAAVAV
jgi:hypothetical protein